MHSRTAVGGEIRDCVLLGDFAVKSVETMKAGNPANAASEFVVGAQCFFEALLTCDPYLVGKSVLRGFSAVPNASWTVS